MATLKQRVHLKNSSGTYDTVHYETEAGLVLYTNNSQSTVSGALDKLFTDMSGKAASSHNHAGSAITSGTVAAARLGTMTGATSSAAGTSGAVPAPAKGAATRYLRSDGTWQVPPDTNTTYSNMTAATADAAGTAGLVPAPAKGKQTSFLRGDGTWVIPTDTNTTYSTFVKSGSTAAAGLVPKPSTTAGTTKYLREDATWVVPPNTTYSNFVKSGTGAAAGLVPAPSTTAGTTKYLREDGTWQVPPDTNTVYTHPTTAGNKHVPAGGSSGQFLGWDSAGTAKWVANPNTNTTYTFATGDNNGQIKVTPSGGTATNIAVKGLGSAAYTASTAYLDAGLGFYANAAVDAPYYVTTSITVATSANAWINGMIEGSRGNSTRPLMVRFMVYWNKSTLSAATYYDPMGGISEISAHLDANNIVYFSFKCTTQYSQLRFFVYTGTTATGGTNSATAISATAPATFSVTKAMTRVYSDLANSGATAGSYGPSANASPAHSGTFSVPYITVDAKGRVTAASTKTITLPADNNTTYSNFVKSGSGAKAGLVPAPSTTAGTTKYLREDGTWSVPPDNNTTYSAFVKSGSTAAAGLVPKPSTTAGTTKYLREDATWAVPPNTDTKVNTTLATTSKAYLLGTTTTPTSTAKAVETIADTGVYLDTTAGTLHATKFTGDGSGLTNIASAGNGLKSITNSVSGSLTDPDDGSFAWIGPNLINTTIYNTIKNSIFVYIECNVTFTVKSDQATTFDSIVLSYGTDSACADITHYRIGDVSVNGTKIITIPSVSGFNNSNTDNNVPIVFRSANKGTSSKYAFSPNLAAAGYNEECDLSNIFFIGRANKFITAISYTGSITLRYI